MLNLSQIEPAYDLLTAMAGNHTPAGSLDEATVDQWLHAIAPTDNAELYAFWDDFLMTKVLPLIEGDADKLQKIEWMQARLNNATFTSFWP